MRNVLVSGGSRGLGLGIAAALAGSGYRVIAVARRAGDALGPAQRRALEEGRGAIEFRAFDLTDVDAIAGFVKGLRAEFGPLHGLVNNAGAADAGLLANASDAAIAALVRLNVHVPLVLSKYVVRSMITGRDGRIVNIASIVANTGYAGLSAYSATKSSLIGFTRSLARELGPLGITVNAVAPGFVSTEMTDALDTAGRDKVARRSALRRMPEVEDVARTVDFLFSEAARNITGTVITVDAGNTA